MPNATTTARSRIERAYERGSTWVEHLILQIRARLSLASGSLLILLTLFLPIGYNTCGPATKGYELLQGQGGWPTFLGISHSEYFGPVFYGVLLMLALGTLLLVGISLWRPTLWQNRSLWRRLFLLSAALSLFLMVDVVALLPIGAEKESALVWALIIASCLAPMGSWPRRIREGWLGPLTLSVLAALVLSQWNWVEGDISAWYMVGIWVIYGLGPLILWLALVSSRGRFGEDRGAIRRGLIAFYFPVAVGNLWFYAVARREGIWGFVPCCLGLYLIALGYMRLAKEGENRPAESMPGGR